MVWDGKGVGMLGFLEPPSPNKTTFIRGQREGDGMGWDGDGRGRKRDKYRW